MGFAELVFTSLKRISAFNPTSRHYVTLATPTVVAGEPKRLYEEQLSRFARITADVRQLAHPSCLVSETGRNPNVNGWLILQRN